MRAHPAAASVLCLCLLMAAAAAAAAAEGLGKGQQTFPSGFALSSWRCREGSRGHSAGWGSWGRAGAALSRSPTRLGKIWPLGSSPSADSWSPWHGFPLPGLPSSWACRGQRLGSLQASPGVVALWAGCPEGGCSLQGCRECLQPTRQGSSNRGLSLFHRDGL